MPAQAHAEGVGQSVERLVPDELRELLRRVAVKAPTRHKTATGAGTASERSWQRSCS